MAQSLPSIVSGEGGLSRYLEEIRRFPMLQPQEEYMLAKRYQEHEDTNAAHKLVTSHLRLVAKIAMGYRGYGLPIGEVISEGNVGLMQAVKKFEPERGFRLATYAMWWIKASIQEYILRSWSLVKMGTTANQKRLFFNLRKVKGKIQAPRAQDVFLDRGLDPPHGVGGQPEAALRLEFLDCLHQADIALRDHLADRQAVAAIAHGDLGDEPEMAGDQLVGGVGVLMLLVPLGEHVLFLRLEHRESADFLKVAGKPALSGNDTG